MCEQYSKRVRELEDEKTALIRFHCALSGCEKCKTSIEHPEGQWIPADDLPLEGEKVMNESNFETNLIECLETQKARTDLIVSFVTYLGKTVQSLEKAVEDIQKQLDDLRGVDA